MEKNDRSRKVWFVLIALALLILLSVAVPWWQISQTAEKRYKAAVVLCSSDTTISPPLNRNSINPMAKLCGEWSVRRAEQIQIRGAGFDEKHFLALQELSEVEELHLISCRFHRQHLASFDELKNLRALSIVDCQDLLLDTGDGIKLVSGKLFDEDLQHLAGLANLESLSLEENPQITGSGLVHLAGLKKLKVLKLSRTSVDDAALQHLTKLPALEVLQISGTKITKEEMDALPFSALLEVVGP